MSTGPCRQLCAVHEDAVDEGEVHGDVVHEVHEGATVAALGRACRRMCAQEGAQAHRGALVERAHRREGRTGALSLNINKKKIFI